MVRSFKRSPFLGKIVKATVLEKCRNRRKGSPTKGGGVPRSNVTNYLGRFTNCNTIDTKERCGSIRVSREAFQRRCLGPFHVTVRTSPTVIVATFGTISHEPIDKGGRLLRNALERRVNFDNAIVSS